MKTKTFTSKFKGTMLVMFITVAISCSAYAQNWTQINSGTTKKINTICFTSSTIGYLGGNDSLLMKSTNGGATWVNLNYSGIVFYPGGEHIINMQFLDNNVGFITVGPYSGSYGTTDGGLTWSAITLAGNQCYNQGLFFFNENNGFIGGSGCFQGELMSNITNSNWLTGTWNLSTLNAPTTTPANIITDIHFYDSNYGLASSYSGYIFRTTDGGLNWDSVATPAPMYPITSVLTINDTLAYAGYAAAGSGFGLYITTDAGLTWSFESSSATFYYPDFLTLHQTDNGTIYTGGSSPSASGIIFRNPGNFALWDYDAVDQKINDIASYNDSVVFAVGDSGYMVVNYPQAITSIDNNINSNIDFSVYPNPATNTLYFEASLLKELNQAQLTIYSNIGQLVKTEILSSSVDVSDLTPGIYFIEVLTNEQQLQKKIVIE